MSIHAHRWHALWVAVAFLTASFIGLTARRILVASPSSTSAEVIATPTRRVPDAVPPAAPALPAVADTIAPVTLVIGLRQDRPAGLPKRQTVMRTVDRIHVKADAHREWLFERNPIDPRRVTAALIDHDSQTIVLHDETDLRMTRQIRGWADALMLGFDEQHLGRYAATVESRTVGVLQFVRYEESGERAVGHVWWNHEQAIASDFAITDAVGRTHVSVESAVAGVDQTLLLPAPHRFPTYRVLDLADWLEKH